MSDFWRGVLALPCILIVSALAAGAVLGAWLVAEHWFRGRAGHWNYEPGESAHLRVRPAMWVLVAPKLWRFRLGFGCSLLFVRGINRIGRDEWAEIEGTLRRSVAEIDRHRGVR